MKNQFISLLLMGLLGLSLVAPVAAGESAGAVARWDFDVYLNDKRVGKHFYEVSDAGGVRRVQSEANFKYKILFIPAYRYEHSNTEQWSDNCLLGFEAKTNANGKLIDVSGEKAGDNFIVDNGEVAVDLPECVMSFAYWDPRFLDETRLLNPQTGEYVEVSVEQVAEEMLEVRGQPVAATRFRLTAYEVDLTLWYSADDQWLALESVAKGGHVIRYELS
jgi:hypothetical protein